MTSDGCLPAGEYPRRFRKNPQRSFSVLGERRKFAFVVLKRQNLSVWADLITGTLYSAETGRCLSSDRLSINVKEENA